MTVRAGGKLLVRKIVVSIEDDELARLALLTLKHGPLVNLDMPAMTMVFKVQSTDMLNGLKVGDAVKFRVEKINGAFTVTTINKATP